MSLLYCRFRKMVAYKQCICDSPPVPAAQSSAVLQLELPVLLAQLPGSLPSQPTPNRIADQALMITVEMHMTRLPVMMP